MEAGVAYGNPYPLQRSYTTPAPGPAPIVHPEVGGGGGRGPAYAVTPSMDRNDVSPLAQSQGHTSSNYSIQSQPSSRSSDTTQGTAHSTLFPPPIPMTAVSNGNGGGAASNGGGKGGGVGNGGTGGNGDVTATDNIMNSVADASSSLFQICVSLRQRLHGVPGFGESLNEEEEDADEDTDPVTLLWRTFRRGYPLMLLYNALRPSNPLKLGAGVKADKRGKAATFKFLQACLTDLKFPAEECFIITDLYGDDTTGFVKVARVVNRVLDILVQRALIEDIRPTASDFEQAEKGMKRTQRQHIVSELVTTERTYVQHLELLQSFKHLVEEKGIIAGDAVHDIFLNLNSLLDFQRRFLIRVEQTNALPETEQNWGKLFVLYCEAFKVYEPYIANQRKCEKTVVAEFSKLREAGGSLEMRQMVESPTSLYGFLMKPFQRLSKYPLLLDDLYKKGDLDEERRADLVIGREAAASVLLRTDKAVDREQKAEAVQELKMRVEDWKGHRVEGFGELLLYGTFTVLKSESTPGKDGERQYHVYLFETILLCCKDIDLSKPKNKLSNKQLVDKRGKPKLQLKGRIFMQNVTDVVSTTRPGKNTKSPISPTSPIEKKEETYLRLRSSARIFWKGDPSIENFIIRFASEDTLKRWAHQIEQQRRRYRERGLGAPAIGGGGVRGSDGSTRLGGASAGVGTSATEFSYLQNQPALENPYKKLAEDDEEVGDGEDDADAETLVGSGVPSWQQQQHASTYPSQSDFEQSRNASLSSLRSRSTTGDSLASAVPPGRLAHPRFPQGTMSTQGAGLALRTRDLLQHNGAISPAALAEGPAGGDPSYFSPLNESPIQSSRTSSNGGMMYPFPRQPQPQNGYYDDASGVAHPPATARFTAPAVARQRESSNGGLQQRDPYAYPSRQPQANAQPLQASQRPAGYGMHSAQNLPMAHRNRSASSPDIHNPMQRPSSAQQTPSQRPVNGQPPIPDVPAPYHQQLPHMAPRSQNNSPLSAGSLGGIAVPSRAPTQSPRSYATRQQQDPSPTLTTPAVGLPDSARHDLHAHSNSRGTVGSMSRTPSAISPPPLSNNIASVPAAPPQQVPADVPPPTQLKVKVHCPSASQTLTLVVPLNISYQSLKDRIDAKLQRSTSLTLSDKGGKDSQVKLKYLDEEDLVSIQSDEDVIAAFEAWREQHGGAFSATGGAAADGGEVALGLGAMGEIELFCQR